MAKPHPFKRWRFESGQRLKDISVLVGASIGHLSEIENRKTGPSVQLAYQLSQLTGGTVRMEDFVNNPAETKPLEVVTILGE